jgi:hypothetical protein
LGECGQTAEQKKVKNRKEQDDETAHAAPPDQTGKCIRVAMSNEQSAITNQHSALEGHGTSVRASLGWTGEGVCLYTLRASQSDEALQAKSGFLALLGMTILKVGGQVEAPHENRDADC